MVCCLGLCSRKAASLLGKEQYSFLLSHLLPLAQFLNVLESEVLILGAQFALSELIASLYEKHHHSYYSLRFVIFILTNFGEKNVEINSSIFSVQEMV